jgi:hypothetical protein
MIGGVRWQVYGVVAVFLILTLALFWPGRSDRDQHRDILTDAVNNVPVSASDQAPISPPSEPSNPFASNGFDPSLMVPAAVGRRHLPVTPETEAMSEPSIRTDTVSNNPPALSSKHTAADWSQWRKADERLRSYLGGPPAPGRPAE